MFDAAIALIDELGTHRTTLKDVGERAGYSRGLASNRFGSKEDLFFELLRRYNEAWKEQLDAAVGSNTGLDAFIRANRRLISFFRSEVKFVRVMYVIWFEMTGSSEKMREQLSIQHAAYRRGVVRWMREAIAEGTARKNIVPEQIAMLYVSSVFGMVYQWLVDPDAVDMSKVLTDLRNSILAIVRT